MSKFGLGNSSQYYFRICIGLLDSVTTTFIHFTNSMSEAFTFQLYRHQTLSLKMEQLSCSSSLYSFSARVERGASTGSDVVYKNRNFVHCYGEKHMRVSLPICRSITGPGAFLCVASVVKALTHRTDVVVEFPNVPEMEAMLPKFDWSRLGL